MNGTVSLLDFALFSGCPNLPLICPIATPTPTPSPGGCLCVPKKVIPGGNLASLRNVEEGGKASTIIKSVTVQLDAREASPGSCPEGATSDPTTVNLFIEDDDGDVVFFGSKKGFICKAGEEKTNAKFGVRFRGPENCAGSIVPVENISAGDLFINATTVDGTLDVVRRIRCRK